MAKRMRLIFDVPSGTGGSMGVSSLAARRSELFTFCLIVLCWGIFDAFVVPPAFGNTDIYYFKDAGINFAQGLGLTTRFTFGNPTFEYEAFATYPPIYTLLFGLHTRIFGTSLAANQLFNSMLALMLGAMGFLVLRRIVREAAPGRLSGWTVVAVGMASVATGYFMPPNDRPDGLGVIFGVLAIVSAVRGRTARSAVAAGGLCALALLTSPFAGIWTSLAIVPAILARPSNEATRVTGVKRIGLVAACGMATVVVALLVLRYTLPGWFDAFVGVVTGADTHNETGGGYFLALLKGDVRTWWSGFPAASAAAAVGWVRLAAVQAALLAAIIVDRIRARSNWQAWRLIPVLILSPLCFITSPYQTNYPPITAALLLVVWASIASLTSPTSRKISGTSIFVAFTAVAALGAPLEARTLLTRFAAHESIDRARTFISSHRAEFDRPGRFIAVSPSNYMVWREAGVRPLITTYSGFDSPVNRERLDYVALAFPGSSDLLQPQSPQWLSDVEYVQAHRPQLPQPARIFTRQLSNSSQTWESELWTRRACTSCVTSFAQSPAVNRTGSTER